MARDGRPTQFRVGVTLGPWELLKRLGGTGNSEVWEASRGEEILAVKFLRGRGANRYQRFKDEVRFLREMAPPKGVLPWRDSHLPERITPAGPAWLAMPIAEPITDALAKIEHPPREGVRAVRDIALTLAGLAEQGIAHRDLKPGNLFRLDADWVVGDFGLVDYPDKPELTRPNQKLGPAHFVADEMINHPDAADPHPADVFSLAKTLWVLCVPGQDYPPSGQQRIEVTPATIGHWVILPQVEQLDLLIERATALEPAKRPTMAQLAAELTAWLDRPRARPAADLSAAAARIGALSEPGLRARQLRDRRRELFTAAVAQIDQHLAGLVEQLATVFPTVDRHENPPLLSDFGHDTEPQRIEQQVTRGAFGTNVDPDAVMLMLGMAAQWVAEDDARYSAWIHVEDHYAGSRLLWSDAGGGALGSAQQYQLVTSLRDGLAEQLPEAVDFVAGRLELRTDRERYASWSGEDSGSRFSYPSTAFAPLAYNDAGCYVVDTGNHRIRRFGPGGIELEWQAQDGQGTGEQQLDHPMGGCFTGDRKIWIADYDNQRLRYFDEGGSPLHGFGVIGPGPEILSGPADVASAPDGTVFVADRSRHRVVVFDLQGNCRCTWGSHGREPGQLTLPYGIAVRHGAYVYVSDSGNDRIQKFDREGNLINCWGGTGGADGYFHAPHGIALDNDENVYVADSRNHRIQQFTSDGELIRIWGSAGRDPGQFLEPRGVAVDGVGNIYVVEHTGQRVQRFGPAYLAAL